MSLEPINPIEAVREWGNSVEEKWLSELVGRVLNKASFLDSSDVNELLDMLLVEKKLIQKADRLPATSKPQEIQPKKELPVTVRALLIKSLKEVKGVNAIVSKSEIEFHPKLTVFYGENATGKSGYVRIFKRASDSRTKEDVWDNIHIKKSKNICSAKFQFEIDGQITPIEWEGVSRQYPFTNIQVFDNKCVKVFLTEKLDFGFRPYGFEFFEMIAHGVNQVKEELLARIKLIDVENRCKQLFISGTAVYQTVSNMNASLTEETIKKLAVFGDVEKKALLAKDEERKALESNQLRVKVLRQEKSVIELVLKALVAVTTFVNARYVARTESIVKQFAEKKKEAEAVGSASLKKYLIPNFETEEWRAFITKAEEYIKKLPQSKDYPQNGSECVYCRQPLGESAFELVRAYRLLLNSKQNEELNKINEAIRELINELAKLDLRFPRLNDEDKKYIESSLNAVSSGLYEKIVRCCEEANNLKTQLQDMANKRIWQGPLAIAIQDYEKYVNDLLAKKNNEITSLDINDKQLLASLASVRLAIAELRDREKLVQYQSEVIDYLNRLQWVEAAQKTQKSISTRAITELSKKVWDSLITENFKTQFDVERTALQAPPVDFSFPGDIGVTKRRKSIEGLENIDDFLSEGEQKAIALADFFAELKISNKAFPVVFDDPVSSFDHIRRDLIAKRLIEESKRRQVVVFTHDIMLLSYLNRYASGDEAVYYHWIQKDSEGCGKISCQDSPMLDSLDFRIKKVESCIERAKLLTGSSKEDEVKKGYANLRSAYENFVIEKVFKRVIQRFDEQIKMMRLREIKYRDGLLDEVQAKFEELSRYIDAHSHSDASRQTQPTVEHLESELKLLCGLKVKDAGPVVTNLKT